MICFHGASSINTRTSRGKCPPFYQSTCTAHMCDVVASKYTPSCPQICAFRLIPVVRAEGAQDPEGISPAPLSLLSSSNSHARLSLSFSFPPLSLRSNHSFHFLSFALFIPLLLLTVFFFFNSHVSFILAAVACVSRCTAYFKHNAI